MQPIDYIEHENLVGFYPVSERSALPFDMFASSFLMITLYNEYLVHKKDKHERYRASQSINYTAGFLHKPMINFYSLALKKILADKYPQLKFKEHKFEYIATVDVNEAFAYRGKGFMPNFKGFARSLFLSNFKEAMGRYRVLTGRKKDPFDTFDDLIDTCKKYAIKTKFFFQVGNKTRLDKNTAHTYEPFRELIKKVSEKSDVGINLSYGSHASLNVMEEEIGRLEYITGLKIESNRFHYLRFTLPTTYIVLSAVGITEDYSFGYATRSGFRAATCSPFYLYNLAKDEQTNVKIYPFAFMDTTLAHYNKLSARESLEKILQIMKWVKQAEGPFIGVWHNTSFVETGVWQGWKNVFDSVAEQASILTEKSE